jgi:DMSO/TMAO reductase YedYZ molybdopterin-dependent catalytic subunit
MDPLSSRREFLLQSLTLSAGAVLLPAWAGAAGEFGPEELAQGVLDASVLEALPGKLPLIKKSFRPPNFETPVAYFREVFTPNDAFFVRYHLANIPQVDAREWRLRVSGDAAERVSEFSLEELRKNFEQVEVAAVCLCSGNRRGLSMPHVAGVQWGHGAMGNARWRGVRLRDVLNKAGVKKEALEVAFDGADSAVLDKTPDFIKSVPVWKALDENTLIAFEMNGEALPHWNGYPARIVVPGWTATYWMKHVTSIQLLSQPLKSFWMNPGYRIPKGKFPIIDRFVSQETETNTPITEMVVNSLILSPADGASIARGHGLEVTGIAWDGGYGVNGVEVSLDSGVSWRAAKLGTDHGRFSWRQWSFTFAPDSAGVVTLLTRATNKVGATQTQELLFNPAGYHNNVLQRLRLSVT